MIKRAALRVETFAVGLGAPGLFLLSFLDSTFLPLPQVIDLLVVVMVIKEPTWWWLYGGLAAAGSVAGCYLLYALARRGGEAFLRRRMQGRHVDRFMGLFRRYGTFTLIVPSLIPPPVPFKPFVLLAGVSMMPRARFLAAIAAGRGTRFLGEALLARWYGRRVITYVSENAGWLSATVLALAAAGGLIWYGYRVARARR